MYDVTNEYADYDIDANEIARYDKKRRGQELTFSRRTDNEFISNYVTLKNRDDIYKGPQMVMKMIMISIMKTGSLMIADI